MPQNLRFALRQIRKSPGFALAAVVTLGLGIGATTAIFSLVNAVLLRPLPFPEPDRLAWIQLDDSLMGGNGRETFSYLNFFDVRDQNRSFSGIASYRTSGFSLSTAAGAQEIDAAVVSADFFHVLGVEPARGRDFLPNEEKGGSRVAMLSWHLWQTTFGGDPAVIGGQIKLDQESYTVAGVMPPDFTFPIQDPPAALWVTLGSDDSKRMHLVPQRQAAFLDLIGRLKPGVSLQQSRAELNLLAHRLAADHPKENGWIKQAVVQPELEHLVGDSRPALRVLLAAVSLVLLIGCANVAGLLLSRTARRRSEAAVLAALGAGRARIIKQVLTETILLSICGGASGVLLSLWSIDALRLLLPVSLPRFDHVRIDGSVLLFAIAVSVAIGILFGAIPAWRMSRVEPMAVLRDSARGATSSHGQHVFQNWLVVGETALSLVLLIGSGLLIRSFVRVLNVNPGFDPHNVLTLRMGVPDDRDARLRLYDDLATKVAALPGVQSVAAAWPLPLSNSNIDIGFEIEGRAAPRGHEFDEHMSVVTPAFFQTMRIPILSGREFIAEDNSSGKPVIIINEAFARKYFPGENPLGKRIKPGLGDGTVNAVMREVVGVVGSVKRTGLTADVDPQYYLPWEQALITWPALCIRTSTDPMSLASGVRAEISRIDREIPVYGVSTLESAVYKAAATPRFQTMLLGTFAAIAMLLAAIGLYAVLSYMVVQRAGEIGVRMALGAQRGDVLRMVLRRGLALAAAGITIGIVAAALMTRYLSGMLYGVEPLDPPTFIVVSAVLMAVSLAASSGPSWRAAKVDPMRVLRQQ